MWFVHEGSPRPRLIDASKSGWDRGIVVDVPHREALTAAGVVEEVASPAPLGCRCGLCLHELEAHDLGVEGVRGLDVAGRDRNMVERHRDVPSVLMALVVLRSEGAERMTV